MYVVCMYVKFISILAYTKRKHIFTRVEILQYFKSNILKTIVLLSNQSGLWVSKDFDLDDMDRISNDLSIFKWLIYIHNYIYMYLERDYLNVLNVFSNTFICIIYVLRFSFKYDSIIFRIDNLWIGCWIYQVFSWYTVKYRI